MHDFLKITQGDSSLLGKNITKQINILAILSYLSPHFYTYSVEVRLRERT